MYFLSRDINDDILYAIAYGDSLGLPYENMFPSTIQKDSDFFQDNNKYYTVTSDDTDHALFTLQALRQSTSPETFKILLQNNFKNWCKTFPLSIGKATLYSYVKYIFNFKKDIIGINSAGNGPLMRSIMIGAYFMPNETYKISEYVNISTLMTHNNKLALVSSYAVALIMSNLKNKQISWSDNNILEQIITILNSCTHRFPLCEEEFYEWENLIKNLKKMIPLEKLYPKGINGYCLNTLYSSIYLSIKNKGDLKSIKEVISLGGDTDSNAMICSAFCYDRFTYQNLSIKILDFSNNKKNIIEVLKRNLMYSYYIFKRIKLRIL